MVLRINQNDCHQQLFLTAERTKFSFSAGAPPDLLAGLSGTNSKGGWRKVRERGRGEEKKGR